jgi:hypothetical protein
MGYELALTLYARNAKVYVACRSEEKAMKAIESMQKSEFCSDGELVFLSLDLMDLVSGQGESCCSEVSGPGIEASCPFQVCISRRIANLVIYAWCSPPCSFNLRSTQSLISLSHSNVGVMVGPINPPPPNSPGPRAHSRCELHRSISLHQAPHPRPEIHSLYRTPGHRARHLALLLWISTIRASGPRYRYGQLRPP